MADIKQPGPLLRVWNTSGHYAVQSQSVHQAPSMDAAERIADAVNQAWAEAWAAEAGTCVRASRSAWPDFTDHVSIKPKDMERSGWITGRDPWEPGVYEVEWMRDLTRFARFDGSRWYLGMRELNTPALAATQCATADRPPQRWRGITEAQARALGVVC